MIGLETVVRPEYTSMKHWLEPWIDTYNAFVNAEIEKYGERLKSL